MRVNCYELNQNEGIPCLVKDSGVNYPEEKIWMDQLKYRT